MSQAANNLTVTHMPTNALEPYPHNARKHPKKQVRDIADSIEAFGFLVPIGIDENNVILSGHGRWEASKLLGLEQVPCVRHEGLTEAQKRAYVLADNKIPEGSTWIKPLLRQELNAISLPSPQIHAYPTGFTIPEIESLFQAPHPKQVKSKKPKAVKDDLPAQISVVQRCQEGDLWQIGHHRLVCGEASERVTLANLMGGDKASLTLSEIVLPEECDENTDHKEFKQTYLDKIIRNITAIAHNGSIHFLFLDWAELDFFKTSGQNFLGQLRDFIVWDNQANEDQNGLYRSGHKLVLAFQYGANANDTAKADITQTHWSHRTNVWSYRQIATGSVQCNELSLAIDLKPVSMLADAICDGSQEGDIIFDPFGWSGSSLIAAHQTQRRAYLCEWDTSYCDLILARAETITGHQAELLSRETENHTFRGGVAA